jgi:tungstate transport system ATP-binding protein
MTVSYEIKDLVVKRSGREVLRADHLQVLENEVLAVIGPNGAGKSTLLLVISHLLSYDEGKILFKGRSIKDLNALDYRRRIALVLQEPLLMDTSVLNNVTMGLRFRKLPANEIEQRAEEWLDHLGIADLRNRAARSLSGGEAQRVSLARAFVLQPEVLLLDEPFSSLDAPTRSKLLEDFSLLLEKTGITTLFITHDLDEALLLGDRVAVLLDGRLRQCGPAQDVFAAPVDRDVAAFVGVETVISGQVKNSKDGQITIEAGQFTLESIGDLEIGRKVLLCLRPEDVTLFPGEEITRENGKPSSSARNRLCGSIKRIMSQGPLMRVVLDCGFPVVALITRASVQEMGLREGQVMTAAFKASAVHLIPR